MAMKKFCQKVTVRSIQSSLINTSNRHNKLILDSILQVVKSPQSCHVDIIYIILVKLRDNENVQHSVELHIQFIICRYPIAHHAHSDTNNLMVARNKIKHTSLSEYPHRCTTDQKHLLRSQIRKAQNQ